MGVGVGGKVGVAVGVGVGVRLGMMGVALGVSVGPSGALLPKLRLGSMVAPGAIGVKVAGTPAIASWAAGSSAGAASVGKGRMDWVEQAVRARSTKLRNSSRRKDRICVICMGG